MQMCCEGSPRFSGRFRVMQRPRSTRTRSSVAAAAAAELEQHRSSERKETTEGGEWKGPEGRVIYKARLISGREKRGCHGVIISPERRLDFQDGSKDKIHCGYGGVKNGFNGR